MEVKVIRVPGTTKTIEIPEGGTVGEALNTADVALTSGEACKVNAQACSMDTVLQEGDKIIVAKGAKGNS